MKRRINKLITLTLILCFLMSEFNIFYSFEFANKDTKLPNGIKWEDKNLRLNLTIFKDLGLVVYGDHSIISNNDFKPKANGYYTKNSVRGEYRYHGYTLGGSIYANTNFPEDEVMTRGENTYRYIPRIWENGNKYYNSKRLEAPSRYTYAATSNDKEILPLHQSLYQTKINNAAPYTLINPLSGDGKFYNYANVQTMPTYYNSGDFRLDHLVTYKEGYTKLWYVNNSLKRDTVVKKHSTVKAKFINKPIFKNIEEITKKGTVTVEVELSGFLDDAWLYDGVDKNIKETDKLLRYLYYNRQDIDYWELYVTDTITNKKHTVKLNSKNVSVQSKFTIDLSYSDYSKLMQKDDKGNIITTSLSVGFLGEARAIYVDKQYDNGYDNIGDSDSTSIPVPDKPQEPASGDLSPIFPIVEEPFYMLDTEKFKLYDRTVENVVDRFMLFDGVQLSEEDEEKMLNGEWLFPLTGEHKLHDYDIYWVNELGRTYHWKGFIMVYSTKANVQVDIEGPHKENRTHIAYNNITSGNPQYVVQRSSYETLTFDIRGDEIYTGTKTDKKIEFISKSPYTDINIDLQVECKVKPQYIERDDIPAGYHVSNFYTYTMHVQEDHRPDIYCVIWNHVLSRNEKLQMTLDIASYDGDIVSDNMSTYKLYYDEDKDGTAEKLIKSGTVNDEIKNYSPSDLGMYEIVFYVQEEFGQSTLEQHITNNDKKYTEIKRQFYVENLAPSTQIYADIPADYPKVDVTILNDKNISRSFNQSIVDTRISFANTLIRESLNPYVYTWDLHTYVSTQEATTIKQTGASYPSDTVPYSSGGYSGTLNRYDQINNQEWEDHGRYVTKYVTETVTGEREGYSYVDYDSGGNIVDTDSTNQPTMDIDGVTASKDSWAETGNNTESLPGGGKRVKRTYKASYSAKIKVPVEVWVPNMVLVDRWTGYYKGNIYKYVKQPFEAVYRDTSNKYVVYISTDNYINNSEDLYLVRQRAKSKLILVGSNALKSSISHDYYIDGSLSLDEIYQKIAEYISGDNPMERGSVILINENFTTSHADVDQEKDPIEKGGFQIVHDKNYFDNAMSQEQNTNTSFIQNTFNTQALPIKFSNAGKYVFYRRINDLPVNHEEKSEYSNIAEYIIYAHRKPIARFEIDWEYNINTGYYDIDFKDTSYDLDLQYKDPENKKGIRERKLIYYNKEDNIKYYSVPTRLLPGKYVINYYAKDNYGVWSDVYTKEIELPQLPPPQLDAKLKAELPQFSLASIPASENLVAHDIWTRYPYDVITYLGLNSPYTTYRQLLSSRDVWKKDGQDMYWNDQNYNIPATVKNGTYTFNVRAVDVLLANRYTELPFTVIVSTPINLVPKLEERIIAEKTYNITATTSKYVNTSYTNSNVTVTMFYNSPYAVTMKMDGNYTNWNKSYRPTKSIPEGMYMAKFIATLPSGEYEEKILYYQYAYNTPPDINGGDLFGGSANLNNNYIYENDDINFILYYQDVDLTPVTIDIKLYDSKNKLLNSISKVVNPVGNAYPPFDTKNHFANGFLYENIPLGHYKLIATVTDDYGETASYELPFEAHDLWVKGAVTHTEDWEKNRRTYNSKYPSKTRDENTYWNGESLETSANTTVINIASLVKCNKVSVEIINNDKPSENRYLQWLNSDNITDDKWKLSYWDKEWVNKNGNVIVRWGSNKKQELTLRFTAYFNNEWIEIYDVKIYIDNQDDYWKLHRAW